MLKVARLVAVAVLLTGLCGLAAAQEIGEITSLSGEVVLEDARNPENIPALVELLGNDDPQVANQSRMALINLGQKATGSLAEAYKKGRNRLEVVKTLTGIGGADAARLLLDAAKDKDAAVSGAANNGLVVTGELELLAEAMKEPSTRETAAEALIAIRSEKKGEVARTYINYPDAGLRLAAAKILCSMESMDVESLTFLLSDEDAAVRKQALGALGRVKAPGIEDRLLEFLHDPDPEVRGYAARGLYYNGTSKSVDELIKLAGSDDLPQIRKLAVEALGPIGDDRAVLPLLDILKDKNPLIKDRVLTALGELKAEEALPYVEKVLYEGGADEGFINGAADYYLSLHGTVRLTPWLGYLNSDDNHIVLDALEVIAKKGSGKDKEVIDAVERFKTETKNKHLMQEADRVLEMLIE